MEVTELIGQDNLLSLAGAREVMLFASACRLSGVRKGDERDPTDLAVLGLILRFGRYFAVCCTIRGKAKSRNTRRLVRHDMLAWKLLVTTNPWAINHQQKGHAG